jgi:hypothetical protein
VRAAVGRAGAVLPRDSARPANAPAIRHAVAPSAAPLAPWLADVVGTEAGKAGLCRETDCLRGFIDADVIADAERRAARIGVGADRVLIAAGVLSEETYLRRLADALGLAFDTLDGAIRGDCPIENDRLVESAAAGMLPLTRDDELCLVVAPRGAAVRRIIALIEDSPALARRFRLTSAECLTRFVFLYGADHLAARATERLATTWPELSAAPPRWRANIVPVAFLAVTILAAVAVAPAQTLLASEVLLAAVFLAWLGLRLAGAFTERPAADPPAGLRDDQLPVYTVICALYREAACVDGLLTALERLDYPGIMAQTPQAGLCPGA